MNVKDKRVVVTGAASGIGKALSEAFHQAGAQSIVAVDMNIEGAQETANSVNGIAVQANVGKEEDIINVVEKANEHAGGIDIFCSNAGILSLGSEQSSNEDWDKNWNLHVMSHVFASKKLIPDMLKRGSGYFVNTASAAGLLSHIDSATYSATKHAAIGFAEWLAITYGKKGIGVSILCPQAVKTAMIKGRENEVSALDGMMNPETVAIEVVKAIKNDIFLISPHSEVVGYFQNKANNYARWIGGMQKLRSRLKS